MERGVEKEQIEVLYLPLFAQEEGTARFICRLDLYADLPLADYKNI